MIEVVGVPASGLDLPEGSSRARDLVDGARVLLGGARHLDLVPEHVTARRVPWPSPLRPGLPALLEDVRWRDGGVVVLASGDPFVSGIATTLVDLLGPDAVRVHPAVSSVALARAAMRWSAQESEVVTLVGRDPDLLRRWLTPGARLLVLGSDATTPAAVGRLLVQERAGASRVTVLGHLGGATESRHQTTGAGLAGDGADHPALHVLALEVLADPPTAGPDDEAPARPAGLLGTAPGLPDTAFVTDGQLTKRVLRAAALAHLRPLPGQLLWDLGAGTGTIGLEWARHHPRCRVVAVERRADRAATIRHNAARLGVPGLTVVEGDCADALADLPDPDAAFLGGGVDDALVDAVWQRLPPGGRLVAHAVTLRSEAVLLAARARHGGTLQRVAVETAAPLGADLGWTPARAVVAWSAVRGEGGAP